MTSQSWSSVQRTINDPFNQNQSKTFEFTCPQHGSVLGNPRKVAQVMLPVHVHVVSRYKLVLMIVPAEPIPKYEC